MKTEYPTLNDRIGNHLKVERISRNKSQEQAAEELDVDLKSWQRYEQGKVAIPVKPLEQLGIKWGIKLDQFIMGPLYKVEKARVKRSANIHH